MQNLEPSPGCIPSIRQGCKNIDTLYTASSLRILQESQPAKNCNLSRLMSNLSRLNWSSERNCVYCFSLLFTLLLQQEVPSTCLPVIFPVQFFSTAIRFWLILDWGTYSTISKVTVRPPFIVSKSLFPIRSPHATPGDILANLSRLKATLCRLIRKSVGN
jgi:hypothetical protein